jgi:hypothetical protein
VEASRWSTTWRYVVGLVACLALLVLTIRRQPVPLLWRVDLGIHELGHFLTYWLPDLGTTLMGSVFQVLAPVGLAAYFLFHHKDLLGSGLCAAWAGTSLQQVSVYVADAPHQALPLLGGEHDWAFILGPAGFNTLDAAPGIALVFRVTGILVILSGIAACGWPLLRAHRSSEPVLAEHRA